jgi:hypothetical protein
MALGETMANISKEEGMPTKETIYQWRQIHPDFDSLYMRAREDQMHAWSDEIVTLIDDAEMGYNVKVPLGSPEMEKIEKNGYVHFKFRRHHLDHAKAKVDVRKYLMSKIVPQVFGDRLKVDATHTVEQKDDAEMIHALQEALRKAGMEPDDIVSLIGTGAPLQ